MFILGIAFIILIEELLRTYSAIIGVTELLCRYTRNPFIRTGTDRKEPDGDGRV